LCLKAKEQSLIKSIGNNKNKLDILSYLKFIEEVLHRVDNESKTLKEVIEHFKLDNNFFLP
jgi:hypothetical protein